MKWIYHVPKRWSSDLWQQWTKEISTVLARCWENAIARGIDVVRIGGAFRGASAASKGTILTPYIAYSIVWHIWRETFLRVHDKRRSGSQVLPINDRAITWSVAWNACHSETLHFLGNSRRASWNHHPFHCHLLCASWNCLIFSVHMRRSCSHSFPFSANTWRAKWNSLPLPAFIGCGFWNNLSFYVNMQSST